MPIPAAPLSQAAPIKLICFDVDGTLVEQTIYIWETLHRHFGSDAQARQQAKADFYAGRISYADWFHHDIVLLRARGADRAGIARVLDGLVPAPGALETLTELKKRGYIIGIISGSLDLVVDRFFGTVALDHLLINRFHFDPAGALIGGEPTPYDIEGKATGLRELARREGIGIEACAFVGDNENDVAVLRAAGFGIGVHVKHPSVTEAADLVLEDPDLRALLPLFPGP